MKFKMMILTLAGLAAFALSACNGGGGGGGVCTTCAVSHAWYNVYGNYCGNTVGPGCDFYADGSKITYAQDPYYASLIYGTYYYTDVFGYTAVYTGWARQSATGILYDDWGRALNSNEKHGRDVVTNAAAAQKVAINGAAQALQAKYGLDADVSANIATALNDWNMIGKSRKRTDNDVAAFTKLVKLDISDVSAALDAAAKGDDSGVDQAISKAAAAWSTNPDTMKQILTDWFGNQNAGGN